MEGLGNQVQDAKEFKLVSSARLLRSFHPPRIRRAKFCAPIAEPLAMTSRNVENLSLTKAKDRASYARRSDMRHASAP